MLDNPINLIQMEFKKDILYPIIAGIALTMILYGIQWIRYYLKLIRKFNKVKFAIHYKYGGAKIGEVELTVKGSSIHYKGKYDGNNVWDTFFYGEFIMNELNLKFGEGFHYHEGYNGFNFPKILIKDCKTMFIESSYYHYRDEKHKTDYWADSHMEVPMAYIWKRI